MGPSVLNDDDDLAPTSEVCAQCEDDLILTEDVFVVQVMTPVIIAGNVRLEPLLDADGDFLYEHYFLHFKCWEEIADELKEEVKDLPPIYDEFSVMRCDCCGSGIREGEPVGAVRMGELIRSKRMPSGMGSLELVESGAPDVFCTYCISVVNDEYLTFWAEGVSIDGECMECRHVRCWRGFDCGCTCHDEGEG